MYYVYISLSGIVFDIVTCLVVVSTTIITIFHKLCGFFIHILVSSPLNTSVLCAMFMIFLLDVSSTCLFVVYTSWDQY